MQCVSSIQVKAPDLTQKGQHTQNKGSPQFRGMRWEGMSVPMSHQGCHSGVQVFWQSKFSSRRAQRRFLVWVPESQRAVRGNPVWASSASLSSLDACLLSLALLRCLSTPFAAVSLKSSLWKCGCYYYACVQVCFPQCMCASPSSVLRGRQRTSALNSPLTPPPPPSLRPSSPPPSLPPSLPSLSWHQHSRDLCQNTRQGCQDTWRPLNRAREGEKTADCFICWVHTVQSASLCDHLLLQVHVHLSNIKGEIGVQYWELRS